RPAAVRRGRPGPLGVRVSPPPPPGRGRPRRGGTDPGDLPPSLAGVGEGSARHPAAGLAVKNRPQRLPRPVPPAPDRPVSGALEGVAGGRRPAARAGGDGPGGRRPGGPPGPTGDSPAGVPAPCGGGTVVRRDCRRVGHLRGGGPVAHAPGPYKAVGP